MRSETTVLPEPSGDEGHGLILDENRLADPPSNEIKWSVSELGEALASIVRSAQEEIGKDD